MASDVIVKIGGDTDEWKESLAGLGSELLSTIGELSPETAGLTALIAGIGTAAIESGEEFEGAYNTIIAKTGATGDQLDDLKNSFNDVFTLGLVPADQLASSIGTISDRLKLSGDDLTAFSTQLAQLSQYTGTDMVANTDAATKALQNWDIATSDQHDKLDYLNTVAQHTGISFQTLANSMADIGNLARLSGESFDQTASIIGTLNAQGIDSQTMFAGMSKAIAQAKTSGLDLSEVTMPGLIKSIQDAKNPTDALNIAIDEFGTRVGPKMAELVASGKISVDSLTTSISAQKDSIAKTSEETDTFGRELTALKDNAMAALAKAFGNFVAEEGKDFLKWINDSITSINTLVYTDPQTLSKLQAAYDKLNPSISANSGIVKDAIQSTTEYSAAGDILNKILGDHTTKVTDVHAAEVAAAAALEYTKEQTQLLNDATTILSGADSQHAENIKAAYTPALMDLATAQNNVNIYKQESAQADQYLTQTEQTLRDLINSHTASNTQLKDAEDAVVLAKASSKTANENLQLAEKDLTASKADDTAITNLLKTANQDIAAALKTDYIPAAMSLADAEAAVTVARGNTQTAIVAEQAAVQALSDFQNQTGFKDAATEKTLKDNLTTATQTLTTARAAETQAIKDAAAVKQTDKALNDDILADTKLLDSFMNQNVFATQKSYQDNLLAIQTLRQKQVDDAAAVQAALQNEQDLQKSGTATLQEKTDAINASKAAANTYKQTTDDLNASEATLAKNFGLSKDQVVLLTTSVTDATNNAPVMQAAYNDLGVKSAKSLTDLATAADQAFADILASGTKSADTLLTAQIADLTAQANAIKATGDGSVPAAMQIQLAALKTKQGDFISDSQQQWSTLYTGIDGDVKTLASSAINTLFTGQGSFHDEGIKALEDMGAQVVTAFTKPFTDAIASLISGAITDLLSGKGLGGISQTLDDIGSKITNIFKSTPSGGGIPGLGGGDDGGGDDGAGDIGGDVGDLGDEGGDAASTAGSALGSISSVFGMVTGAISAITGVLSLFGVGQGGQKDRLDGIDNATTYLAWAYDAGGVHTAILDTNNTLHYLLDTSFNGWYKDWLDDKSALFYEMNDRQKDIDNHLTNLDFAISFADGIIPMALANIATLVNQPPTVNVSVKLDSTEIAAQVTTTVENSIKLAIS